MQMAKTWPRWRITPAPACRISASSPTTAGVMASTRVGDIIIAEPGAMIGFAGPRDHDTTQGNPPGFQTAEFLWSTVP